MFKFIKRMKLKKRLEYLIARRNELELSMSEDIETLNDFNDSGMKFMLYFYRNLENTERELADVKDEINYIQDELRKGAKKDGRH